MIDGFGWFGEADYRRSWLFFDDVDYLFPRRSLWPGYPPAWASSSPDFSLKRPEFSEGDLELLVERVRDVCDDDLSTLVRTKVPQKDQRSAVDVLSLDEDLMPILKKVGVRLEPPFALTFLAAKLLAVASATKSVPIVGQPYASEILASLPIVEPPQGSRSRALLSPRGKNALVTVATGLSCDFVSDGQLLAMPFERLVAFKKKHLDLLAREQLHLVETAQEIEALPEDGSLESRLARVRLSAAKRKQELEQTRREAWLGFGFQLGAKALVSAGAGFTGALAVMRGGTQDLLHAAAAGAVTGLGVVAAGIVETSWDVFKKRGGSFAYLFAAEAALRK
jgi:hypothetical protein